MRVFMFIVTILEKLVANLWTEFSAQRGEALATNGEKTQNL